MRGAESPGARADDDLCLQTAELLYGRGHGVRTEQAPPRRRAALMGIEGGADPAIQWIRRGELHATDHGQRQQRGAPCAGTDADQPGQLILGEHVQQR